MRTGTSSRSACARSGGRAGSPSAEPCGLRGAGLPLSTRPLCGTLSPHNAFGALPSSPRPPPAGLGPGHAVWGPRAQSPFPGPRRQRPSLHSAVPASARASGLHETQSPAPGPGPLPPNVADLPPVTSAQADSEAQSQGLSQGRQRGSPSSPRIPCSRRRLPNHTWPCLGVGLGGRSVPSGCRDKRCDPLAATSPWPPRWPAARRLSVTAVTSLRAHSDDTGQALHF